MKFCKNLQRVVDISDPEWAPYWTNYKMLKKLIKELPSLVPSEEEHAAANLKMPAATQRARAASQERPVAAAASAESMDESSIDDSTGVASAQQQQRQHRGDKTTEQQQQQERTSSLSQGAESLSEAVARAPAAPQEAAAAQHDDQVPVDHDDHDDGDRQNPQDKLGKSPGEVAFFKLLHAEFKKAERFFEKTQQEFIIREERVREGMDIMKQPNSIMVSEKWSLLAKSLHRLYKDLLLLETFAIMTYCAFSKILKKHDKVTGYNTRSAFMANVVNKANFTNYPLVLQMIDRCERAYEEVSENLVREGKEDLYEDERLFINMVHRLNEQVLDTAEGEGVERKEARRASVRPVPRIAAAATGGVSEATSSLRSLVEENDAKLAAANVSEGHLGDDLDLDDCDDDDDECEGVSRKRKAKAAQVVPPDAGAAKRKSR